jgi:pantetheine-phosphate adenylyltransferase
VIVAVGVNRQKLGATDSLESRHAGLQAQLLFHEVTAFSGLLSGYLDGLDFPVTVVRGVRDGTDLEAELRFARFLNELRAGTEVVWISCEPEFQHLSSGAIRELESIEPEAGRRYVADSAAIYGVSG